MRNFYPDWLRPLVVSVSLLASITGAHAAEPLAVQVTNRSEPVLCAEKDNVTLELASDTVRHFRIEAAHPAYIDTMRRDSIAPDWTSCDMKQDPVFKSDVTIPTRRTIYEEPDFWLVAWTFPTYWRPATATVSIGDRVHKGIHLLQLWMIRPNGGEEVLVMYPQDGYWRIRPKAPDHMATTAFGSSFLVGPVEMAGRPVVAIKDIDFDPRLRSFSLLFEKGGRAALRLAEVTQQRTVVEVNLNNAVKGKPFAALRSMFVTEFNADVARVAVREQGAAGWAENAIMTFKGARATHVWTGRRSPSRHNTSAPDIIFNSFGDRPGPSPTQR